jgi:hypothetical protein
MSKIIDGSFGGNNFPAFCTEDDIEDLLLAKKIKKDFNFFFKEEGASSVSKENHSPTTVNELKEKEKNKYYLAK